MAMEIEVLFVGSTGVGKSFLCNQIFEMYSSPTIRLESGASLAAVTRKFEGKKFTYVDIPGFVDKKDDCTPFIG